MHLLTVANDYYRIVEAPADKNLIRMDEFMALGNDEKELELFFYSGLRQQVCGLGFVCFAKAGTPFSIRCGGKDYKLSAATL